MSSLERTRSEEPIRGEERALEVRLGSLGGIEVRPTRLFVWKGAEREGAERVVPLADRPVGLDYERTETTTRAGAVEVRSVGNPLMTVALAGAIALRRWLDADETPPRR
ncbi:MAG: hypothetical protein R3C15_03400 [Thermoleophilia bacterium]